MNQTPLAWREDGHMSDKMQNGTTTLQLVLAWGFVGIPLIWGVIQTVISAFSLFQ